MLFRSAATAHDLNALNVFGVNGKVEQVMRGMGRAPTYAVYPKGHLLKRPASDGQVGLGTERSPLSRIHTGYAFQETVNRRLCCSGQKCWPEGLKAAWKAFRFVGEAGLDHGFGDDEGVLRSAGRGQEQQEKGEWDVGLHAGRIGTTSLRKDVHDWTVLAWGCGQRNTLTPAGSGTGCAEAAIIDLNLEIDEAWPVKSGVRWCNDVGVTSSKSWWWHQVAPPA